MGDFRAKRISFVMIWPTTETLNHIAPHLSDILVSPEAFENIKTVTDVFPNALSAYYLECRLSSSTTQVDLLACANAERGGRDVLSGQDDHPGLPAFVMPSPLWQQVDRFIESWANPASPLHENVPMVWLEFDILGPPPEIPIPSFHVCLAKDWTRSHADEIPSFSPEHCLNLANHAFELALGSWLDPAVASNLKRTFDALPEGGRIVHFSTMMAREPLTFKVYSELAATEALKYLADIGWPGSMKKMEALLDRYCTGLDTLRLEFNVGEQIQTKTGIEFLESMDIPDDPDRQVLLYKLKTDGVCLPEKVDALMSWPGTNNVLFDHHEWPTPIKRWMDIKLIYHHEAPLEAKAYLGFMPYFSLFIQPA